MKVYLSYASEDEELARALAMAMKSEGIDLWVDFWEILPGDDFFSQTASALEECDSMVVLVTANSVKSRHVKEEIRRSLRGRRYKERLVPVWVGSPKDLSREVSWVLDAVQGVVWSGSPALAAREIAAALATVPA
ncbi:MAG: toll/interleukin-1 receptor domain-containing protein [Bryobacteraceae bacterium]|nr:toll/interleukin-1 receptor domain-containing protein [Bryobacteraceae bacterium]